jgi:tetratricopeptide (TPR) repeat protein
MKDMASEEQILDQSLASNAVFIQYIQDLYRFFKLFSSRAEFEDIFSRRIRLNELAFYPACFGREGFPVKVAAFYFDNDHFAEAIDAYEGLLAKGEPNGEYFEKTGYCYQKTGLYKKAVEYYRKAELFDTNRLWILKKLGWCCLKLKDYRQALRYFNDAAVLQPDDLQLKLQAGQCLLNLREFEEALHHYSGLRYFLPEDLKVLRPLAWCQFVMKKPEAAREIYSKILTIALPPSAYDLMNAAHVRLCLGERNEALELYRNAMLQSTPGAAALSEAFAGDAQHLIDNGLSEADIPLVRDYLLFHSNS